MAVKNSSKKGIASLALLEVGLFELGFVLVVIAIILGVLNYFNIISLSTLYPNLFGSLPHQTPKDSVQTQLPSPSVTLTCPVSLELCNSAEEIIYKGNPGLGYKLPSNTSITSIAPVVDSLQFFEEPYKETNPKGLYQSYISTNNCYTVTYAFPYSTEIKKIDLLPLAQGTLIATSGATLDTLPESNDYNLIVQIQKRALGSGQYDFQKCSVKKVEPKDFGTYENIDKSTFK